MQNQSKELYMIDYDKEEYIEWLIVVMGQSRKEAEITALFSCTLPLFRV